jgi:zinc protease
MKKTPKTIMMTMMMCAMAVMAKAPALEAQAAPAASAPAAAAPKVALPTADALLANYVKAIGGRDAWMKATSRLSKGTINVPAYNIEGTVEVHMKAPDKLLSVAVIGGQAYKHGFDGTVAWSDTPNEGLTEEKGSALAAAKREADFYHQLDLQKLYSQLTVTGVETVNGHDTFVLEAVTPEGAKDHIYFDTKTYLILRSVNHRASPEGTDAVYTGDLEDYRDVDGMKIPFVIHQSSDQAAFVITFTDVKNNVELTDDQFTKPAQ